MHGIYFDFASALLATISAALWAFSARVSLRVGFDMDEQFNKAMKKSSALNSRAATIAALAAVVIAVKSTLIGFGMLAA